MSPLYRYQAAVIVALVGAALIDPTEPSTTIGLLLFGIGNVLLRSPATLWTRTITCIVVCWALVSPAWLETTIVVLLGVMWPTVFLMEWTLRRDDSPETATPFGGGQPARLATAAIIAAAAVASLQYQWLFGRGLQQSAALFVGIPTLLAIVTVFAVSPRSATGVACKAVTIALLISMIFLGEGVLCVALSAPLFYLAAVITGKSIDKARGEDGTTFSLRASTPVLVLIVMSLEGVHHATSFDRDEAVTVTRIVSAPADAVARALFERPRFERAVPALLRAGFPQPIFARRDAPTVGARWTIAFRGGEMRIDGLEPRVGDLTLELVEAAPGLARWDVLGDDSHMTHYLAWRGSTVRWAPVSAHETRVEWTVRYQRSLDPAWYFGPIERFAVTLAAGYLIDSVATP
jgi:hypothetical protein